VTRATLVIAPYPPVRDGIANYALQQVARLRAAGDRTEVLSPWPSAAHHHRDLTGARGVLGLLPLVRAHDRVIVHYHPELFRPRSGLAHDRILLDTALARVFAAAPGLEVLVHEADYRLGTGTGLAARAHRAMWREARRIMVHTERERADLIKAFRVDPARVRVTLHGADFARRTAADRAAARRSLGVPPGETLFLSIGFLQPHKGFDRAIRAFAGLAEHGCRLAVVGAVRVEEPGALAHLDELYALAAATPGVELRAGFVSDEMFDRWIVAADVVVLPYRLIWSSSVLERALLYDRPVIATRVGGLEQQLAAQPLAVLADDDAELRRALWAAAGQGDQPPLAAGWPTADRDAVLAEVRQRAAARRAPTARLPTGGATARRAVPASAPLRRLPPLAPPSPVSRRPGWTLVKRVVNKLTYWQIKDLIAHVNALHAAVLEVVERTAASDQVPRSPKGPGARSVLDELRDPLV
jgi:glycosyltransferase involved in cell wall biosynthesis